MKPSAVASPARALTVTVVARNPPPKAFVLAGPSAGAEQRAHVTKPVWLARNQIRDDHGYFSLTK
jgi:hypothetical protein